MTGGFWLGEGARVAALQLPGFVAAAPVQLLPASSSDLADAAAGHQQKREHQALITPKAAGGFAVWWTSRDAKSAAAAARTPSAAATESIYTDLACLCRCCIRTSAAVSEAAAGASTNSRSSSAIILPAAWIDSWLLSFSPQDSSSTPQQQSLFCSGDPQEAPLEGAPLTVGSAQLQDISAISPTEVCAAVTCGGEPTLLLLQQPQQQRQRQRQELHAVVRKLQGFSGTWGSTPTDLQLSTEYQSVSLCLRKIVSSFLRKCFVSFVSFSWCVCVASCRCSTSAFSISKRAAVTAAACATSAAIPHAASLTSLHSLQLLL